MKPGDMVEVLPEFLEEEEYIPPVGIILMGSEEWGDWWVVLRGNRTVEHPPDTVRLIDDETR